jgi:hypothetical protein
MAIVKRINSDYTIQAAASGTTVTIAADNFQVEGSVGMGKVLQLPVYADNAARDAAIPSPQPGMMIFNSTGTRFQGYTGAAWVDLN